MTQEIKDTTFYKTVKQKLTIVLVWMIFEPRIDIVLERFVVEKSQPFSHNLIKRHVLEQFSVGSKSISYIMIIELWIWLVELQCRFER